MAQRTPVTYMRDGQEVTPWGEVVDQEVDRATTKGRFTEHSAVADVAHLGAVDAPTPSPGELSVLAMARTSESEQANRPEPENFEEWYALESARIRAEALEEFRAGLVKDDQETPVGTVPEATGSSDPVVVELTPAQKAKRTKAANEARAAVLTAGGSQEDADAAAAEAAEKALS